MAGLAALAIASTASAQTNVIHITLRVPNASKKSLSTAIGNILNSGYVFGYAGGTNATASSVRIQVRNDDP